MMIRQQSFVAAVLLVLPLQAFLTFQQFTHQIGLRSTFADEDAHLLPRGNVTASVVVKVYQFWHYVFNPVFVSGDFGLHFGLAGGRDAGASIGNTYVAWYIS